MNTTTPIIHTFLESTKGHNYDAIVGQNFLLPLSAISLMLNHLINSDVDLPLKSLAIYFFFFFLWQFSLLALYLRRISFRREIRIMIIRINSNRNMYEKLFLS